MSRFVGRVILASVLSVPVAYAQMSSPAPSGGAPTATAVPSVETFFQRAKYQDVTLSPDGRFMAALVPLNQRRNLALIDLQDHSLKMLTALKEEDVWTYEWVGDRVIEIATGNLADESGNVQMYQRVLIDTDGHVLRDLRRSALRESRGVDTVHVSTAAYFSIVEALDRDGNDLIVETNERSRYTLDAYRFDPRDGTKQLLTANSPDGEVHKFIADHQGQVRVAVSTNRGQTKQTLWIRKSNDDAWTKWREAGVEDDDMVPVAFDYDDRTLYVMVRPASGARLAELYRFDTSTNTLGDVVYQDKDVDVGGLVFDRMKKTLAGVRASGRVHWIDPEWAKVQRTVDEALPGMRNRLSWAAYRPDRLVIASDSQSTSPTYYLFDRKTARIEYLASARPWLDKVVLGTRKSVRYAARDGLSIPAHLTLPPGVPAKQLPLVVIIHGGPYVAGGAFGFDREAHFLSTRGYAVLEPDFRGTKGYGDAFYKAGWRQWGLAMQDDVTDGVKWLEKTGVADPDRVCLFGASYGGYATLWGLEKEPQMFRCGVAFVAVSDLELMFDVNWSDFMQAEHGGNATETFTRWIGDPDTDRDKMREVSPVRHADRIQAPLLLAYGSADTRVPLIHGTKMRDALDRYHKPYEWVVYTDEWHGFNKDENVFDFYRRVDAFLAEHLRPRKPADAPATAGAPTVPAPR